MTLQRRHDLLSLSGFALTVWEASWDTSMARSAMEVEARKQQELKQGDPDLLTFQEKIYAALASASTGDVPTVEQAYQLPDEELDAWFEAARTVDPESYTDERAEPETITLRDGSTITVWPAYLPSVLRRLYRLEREAEQGPENEAISDVTFRVLYFPKLAACSTGNVPTMEEARAEWPTSELNKWYMTARRVSPQLFLPLEEIALANQAKAAESEKKKERSRRKS